MTTQPTILRRAEALLTLADGELIKDHFRHITCSRWSDERNMTVTAHDLYQPIHEDAPWTLRIGNAFYQQGQCSGPQMWWLDYELQYEVDAYGNEIVS